MAREPDTDIEGRIGRDDRQGISRTLEPPHSAICVIGSFWANGYINIGTGYIFGPKSVFTVAHNVFKPEHGGMPQKVQVVPGCVGVDAPFGYVTVLDSALRIHPAYVWSRDPMNDLAAILLPTDLGNRTGWSDCAPIDPVPGTRIVVTGYAGDVYRKTGTYVQMKAAGQIGAKTFVGLPSHDADALVGASGGPIWRESDQPPYVMVCGLHKGEVATKEKQGGLDHEVETNVALMLTWAHHDWIQARMREAEGLPFADWDRQAMAADARQRAYRKAQRATKGSGPLARPANLREGFAELSGEAPDAPSVETEVEPAVTKAANKPKPDTNAFRVAAKGKHEIPLTLRAGDTVAGRIKVALPGGSFTDCELALKTNNGRTVDYLKIFVSSSGARDFTSERFSFAAAKDGDHLLTFRELNGSGAAIVELTLKEIT